MRVLYLDPGLQTDVGHHAAYCRAIAGELRRRGIDTRIYAHRKLGAALAVEHDAIAHFRAFTYEQSDGDPISGWLTAFDTSVQLTREDLAALPAVGAGDLVMMNSALAPQVMALAQWLGQLPSGQRPTVVVESYEAGLRHAPADERLAARVPDPRLNPRAMLYHYVARRVPRQVAAGIRFVTFESLTTALFRALLRWPVETLPLPYGALGPLRSRAGAQPVTVAILGHQRRDKGYDRLPAIVTALLQSHADIRLMVQNATPLGLPETAQALRDLAAGERRLVLMEEPAGRARWTELLEQTDLGLLPYPATPYTTSYSSIMAEFVANAIPVVVPAGTTMERLLQRHSAGGVTFDRFEAPAIAAAVGRALANFDHLATMSHATAQAWPRTQGPARMVDALLALAAQPATSVAGPR